MSAFPSQQPNVFNNPFGGSLVPAGQLPGQGQTGGPSFSGQAGLQQFLQSLNQVGQTQQDIDTFATDQGYKRVGSDFVKTSASGIKFTISEADMRKRQQAQQGGGFLQQLFSGLGFDLTQQQGAAERMFQNLQGQITGFEDFLGERAGDFEELAGEQFENLSGLAGDIEQQAQEGLEAFETGASETLADVRGQVSKAEELARLAAENFEDRVAQDAAAAATGIRGRAQSESKRIAAGLNPDGSMMTPAERFAAQNALRMDTETQVQTQITGLMSNFNNVKAQLEVNRANVALSGGQLLGQVGVGLAEARTRAQAVANQMTQFGAGLRLQGEQIRSAAQLNAVNFEMQGRQALFQMIQNNPEGIVSVYAALASFFGAATTPGGFQIPAFQFPAA